MNKFSNIVGQILQIFSKNEFYKAVMEAGSEREAKEFTYYRMCYLINEGLSDFGLF